MWQSTLQASRCFCFPLRIFWGWIALHCCKAFFLILRNALRFGTIGAPWLLSSTSFCIKDVLGIVFCWRLTSTAGRVEVEKRMLPRSWATWLKSLASSSLWQLRLVWDISFIKARWEERWRALFSAKESSACCARPSSRSSSHRSYDWFCHDLSQG